MATRSVALVASIQRECGRLDIVVNNAGVNTLKNRVTIDSSLRDEWDRMLNVDLNGVFEVSRAAAQLMKTQGGGRIINIASIAGLVPCGCSVRSSPPRQPSSISPKSWRWNWGRPEFW